MKFKNNNNFWSKINETLIHLHCYWKCKWVQIEIGGQFENAYEKLKTYLQDLKIFY